MTTPAPRPQGPQPHGPQQRTQATVREFAQGLASVLRALRSDPDRWLVTVEMARRPPLRYLQFLAGEGGTVVAECVSNRFLDPEERWRPDQERLLLELGWSSPREDQPNWHFVARNSAALQQVRELVDLTLAEVFGVGEDDVVELETFSSEPPDGRSPAGA